MIKRNLTYLQKTVEESSRKREANFSSEKFQCLCILCVCFLSLKGTSKKEQRKGVWREQKIVERETERGKKEEERQGNIPRHATRVRTLNKPYIHILYIRYTWIVYIRPLLHHTWHLNPKLKRNHKFKLTS